MTEQEKIFRRIAESPRLPRLPEGISHIFALLSRENTGIDELAAAIEADEALRAILLNNLKNFNNIKPVRRRRVETVREAIIFWGTISARNIVTFFIIHAFYLKERARQTKLFTLYHYWTYVLATAVAAEEIARKTGYHDPFQMFTYGLLHDIGILAIEACLPEEGERIVEKMRRGASHRDAERSVLGGLTHGDIGAWLCRRAGFSEDIIHAVQNHHEPEKAGAYTELARILNLANTLGTQYVADELPVEIHVSVDPAVLDATGLTHRDMELVAAIMPERIRRFPARPTGF